MKQKTTSESRFPYKEAKLNDCGGDLSKRWYIGFYVWNILENILERKRDYYVNKFKTLDERYIASEQRIKSINEILSEGYYIDESKDRSDIQGDNKEKSLTAALEEILEINRNDYRPSTYLSYKSTLKAFCAWIRDNGYGNFPVSRFDRYKAIMFTDYLVVEKKLAGRTINDGYVSCLKSLFNDLVDRGTIEENPFNNIKKKKVEKSYRNLAFGKDQVKDLKKHISKQEPELWFFVQFIYYCFMRPNEIRQLKYNNINLKTKKLFVPAYISKNRKEAHLELHSGLVEEIRKNNIGKNKDSYIFTGIDGIKPISKNQMTTKHKKFIEALNYNNKHTLYSWKHTGVVSAYNAGVKIKSIQMQCRHSSI